MDMQNETWKVSVIVPVYNAEQFIESCVASIVGQSYRNLEIILINDGSIDSSYNICKKLALLDNRIQVINQENKGVGITRQIGIDCSSGDFILFVDNDDVIDKEMVKDMVEQCVSNDADIAVCQIKRYENSKHYKILDSISDISSPIMTGKEYVKLIYKNEMTVVILNKLFSKRLFKNNKFNDYKKGGEDVDIIVRLFLDVDKIVYINKPYYHYFRREDSVSAVNKQGFDIGQASNICKILENNIELLRKYECDNKTINYAYNNYLRYLIDIYEKLIMLNASDQEIANNILRKIKDIGNNILIIDKYFNKSKKKKLMLILNDKNIIFKLLLHYEGFFGKWEKIIRKNIRAKLKM